jgi:hypothetical protein
MREGKSVDKDGIRAQFRERPSGQFYCLLGRAVKKDAEVRLAREQRTKETPWLVRKVTYTIVVPIKPGIVGPKISGAIVPELVEH